MVTPYCSKDQFAKRRSSKNKTYDDWDDFTASEDYPDANALDDALEDATNIINDLDHIGCLTTNISDTDYTARLERLCYNVACRILGLEIQMGMQGANFGFFSPQDKMFQMERNLCVQIGLVKGYRKLGGFR